MADVLAEPRCPVAAGRDDRKSAAAAQKHHRAPTGAQRLTRFSELRAITRSPRALQAMPGREAFGTDDDKIPVAFLNGDAHRRRRTAIARYFTPKAISSRYEAVIAATSDRLIAEMRTAGTGRLDVMSFDLAALVVAEVVGLTAGDNKAMSARLRQMLSLGLTTSENRVARFFGKIVLGVQMQNFYRKDVAPAIAAHRAEPREDVLSYMMQEGYSTRAILAECFVYGMAGMTTTRELITMAAWHMFDDPSLKARFLEGSEAEQLAIVEEILRLEPVGGMIHREMPGDAASADEDFDAGTYALDIRAANVDEETVGACPYAIDPERAIRRRQSGSYMSFGDGPHRCPGAQLALQETRVFLDKLMRVPGLKLAGPPRVEWNSGTMGYELRDAIVTCDKAA